MLIVVGAILAAGAVPTAGSPAIIAATIAGGALVFLGGWIVLRARAWNTAVSQYIGLVQKLSEGESADTLRAVQRLRQKGQFHGPFFDHLHGLAYQGVVFRQLQAVIERGERSTWLERVTGTLEISEPARAAMAIELFRKLFWAFVEDQELSPGDEAALVAARDLLTLPEHAVDAELALIDEFRRARALLSGALPTVDADIPLQRGELCHHQTTGALVEERVVRTQQIAGERVKETEWRAVREGRLYVTSKRILVVGEGTTSIPFEKILDVEVDVDDQRIAVTKDGRQTPYFLTAVDPIYTGAVIERRHGASD